MSEQRVEIEVDPSGARTGGRVVNRVFDQMADKADRAADKARNVGDATGKSFGAAGRSASQLTVALGRMAGAASIAAISMIKIGQGISDARGLSRALGEASTLIEGTTHEMSLMRQEARRMAVEFGSNSTQQVRGFYQAISAGAGSVEEATVLLEASNKLALGGVTTVTKAVDVLTSTINAYGKENITAARASDILFTGVKAGKTTVDELSRSLGQVLPFASATGTSFEELVAGIAALTKQGQSTSIAVTGMRGALGAILKPTGEAAKLAESLGLEFNAAGLKAKGFAGFMRDVMSATNGNQEQLSILFGGLEALSAVLALAGRAGEDFEAILTEMGTATGATDEAVAKMANTVDQQLNVQMAKLNESWTSLGNAILQVGVPALNMIIERFEKGAAAAGHLASAVRDAAVASSEALSFGQATLNFPGVGGQGPVGSDGNLTSAPQNGPIGPPMSPAQIRAQDHWLARKTGIMSPAFAKEVAAAYTQYGQARSAAERSIASALLAQKVASASGSGRGGDPRLSGGNFAAWDTVATNGGFRFPGAGSGGGGSLQSVVQDLSDVQQAAITAGQGIAQSIGNGLQSAIVQGKSFGDTMRGILSNVLQQLLQVYAINPLVKNLGNLFSGGLMSLSANGNAFNSGAITAFADGGIVNGPTLFPMRGGTGLMGEAGPEAIMPLSRGPDGKLGVRGGGGGVTVNMKNNFAEGVNEAARAEIIQALPIMKDVARQAVKEAISKGQI